MNSNTRKVINKGALLSIMETVSCDNVNTMRNLKSFVKNKQYNIEFCWDILSSYIDSKTELRLDSFRDDYKAEQNNQLSLMYQSIYRSNELQKEVDVEKLLDIKESIGLKCPYCNIKNVKYILIAQRRADEGMVANCECRECGKRFRMRN